MLPVEWLPWFRMTITDLPPSVYWQQDQEDIEIVTALQEARYRGESRAEAEIVEKREQERKDAEAAKRKAADRKLHEEAMKRHGF